MSDKRLKRLAALTGLALVGVIVAGALVGSKATADDLQSRAELALSAAGIDGIEVDVNGREARLAGGTPDDLGSAERIVGGIKGVRRVELDRGDNRAAAPDRESSPTSPSLTLRRTGQGLTISGTVPDPDAAVGSRWELPRPLPRPSSVT